MNRSRAFQRFGFGLFALTGGLTAGFAGCGGGSTGTTSTGGESTTTAAGTTTASSTTSGGTGGSAATTTTTSAGSTTASSTTSGGTGGSGGAPPCAGCVVVAALPAGSAPYGLDIDANNVYWTNSGPASVNPPALGTVMQAKKDGTGVVTLATGEDTPFAVHTAGGFAYWTSYSVTGVMRKTPIGGGPITALVDAPTARDFVIGASSIWWSREPDDMQSIPIGGVASSDASSVLLLTGNKQSNGITADANSVYWVNKEDGYVKRSDFDFANDTPLSSGDVPWDCVVDAKSLYWTEKGSAPNVGKVMSASKVDGSNPVTIATGQSSPQGIAIDATHVYWGNAGDGSIMKAPLGGGAATVLAAGQGAPANVAVDGTHVYWTDPKNDLVVKVPK